MLYFLLSLLAFVLSTFICESQTQLEKGGGRGGKENKDDPYPCNRVIMPYQFAGPLSLALMLEPMMTSEGSTYDAYFIKLMIKAQQKAGRQPFDPLTRGVLSTPITKSLEKNFKLADAIQTWLEEGICTPPPNKSTIL